MTNYSFDPPAKKAMDETELSELISGLSADESGIEKAMTILQEQEALRITDKQEFQNWRDAMIEDGSADALRAVEKVTGEVLVEPEPEPEPEPLSVEQQSEDSTSTDEEPDNAEEQHVDPQENTSAVTETTEEIEVTEDEQLSTVEIIEESVSVVTDSESIQVEYASISFEREIQTVTPVESLSEALSLAAQSRPAKIRQKLSAKFVLGISVSASVFGLSILLGETLLPNNPWAFVGMLLGSVLGFGLYIAQAFQKQSFSHMVSQRLGSLGVFWRISALLGLTMVLVGVSNLGRDNRFFSDLELQPALIVDYEVDEITLVVLASVLFASIMAWQPMLRFALIRIFALLAVVSTGLTLSGIETEQVSFGDFDGLAFIVGTVTAGLITIGMGIVSQPNFASDHDRPAWAVGEFNTRRLRVATGHGMAFILLPGFFAFFFNISGVSVSTLSEFAQGGLLATFGLALLVVTLGAVDFENKYLRLSSLTLLSAGLVVGEYLTNDWVEGLALIGLILLTATAASGLVIRFFVSKVSVGWLSFVGIVLAGVVGWLVENPFGLLDLGFEGYSDLQGYGLGILAALLVSGLISLGTIRREKADENS